MNKCQVHKDCEDPAVAMVGSSPNAVWVCLRGLEDFQEGKLDLLSKESPSEE